MRRYKHRVFRIGILTMSSLFVASGWAMPANAAPSLAKAPHRGGSLVMLNTNVVSWGGLNPSMATSLSAVDVDQAIFGQLFAFGNKDQIVPQLATKFAYSNANKTLTLSIRPGVVFSNGDPFDAKAVASSMQYTLAPSTACSCDQTFAAVKSIAATGKDTVQITLKQAYAPLMASIVDSALDFIVDTKAMTADGATAYDHVPIGAGPYTVSQDVDSSMVVLNANPRYYQKGLPYVSTIKYEPSSSGETALQDVESGQAQLIEQLTTIGGSGSAILAAKKDGLKITQVPGNANNVVELNSTKPPFNNIKAREAVYYATDAPDILKFVAANFGSISDSPSGPGGQFYEKTVPGYREYSLAKAKQLVRQLGGLSFTLSGGNFANNLTLGEALQKMYAPAGIKVRLNMEVLSNLVTQFESGNWQASPETFGNYDPDIGIGGLIDRYECKQPFSGTCDATLDKLIAKSERVTNTAARTKIFDQIYERISSKAYGPFLYVQPNAVVSAKNVAGISMPGGVINFTTIQATS